MTNDLRVTTLRDSPEHVPQFQALTTQSWPPFMLHDRIVNALATEHMRLFDDFQLLLFKGQTLAAVACTVPLHLGQIPTQLPPRGLNWGLMAAVRDHRAGTKPDALMGVQVAVNPSLRGHQLGQAASIEMVNFGKARGLDHLIIPLRPSGKHKVPWTPMAEYLDLVHDDGMPVDSWVRTHVKLGAKTLNICPRSMLIMGTVADWEGWTGMAFPTSGDYVVDQALCPVSIDLEQNIGRYLEPNVWVWHDLAAPPDQPPS